MSYLLVIEMIVRLWNEFFIKMFIFLVITYYENLTPLPFMNKTRTVEFSLIKQTSYKPKIAGFYLYHGDFYHHEDFSDQYDHVEI